MATSPKGFTQIAASDPPNGPGQINAAELFVESLIGESVSTSSSLPLSGNWTGRTIFVIDAKTLHIWTGSDWQLLFAPAQTFTPEWDGFSVGSGGTSWGMYHVANGICDVFVAVVLGSSPTVNDPHLHLPVPVNSGFALDRGWLGQAEMIDDSAGANGQYVAGAAFSAGTARIMHYDNVMNALSPFTWATNDRITIHLSYPV